MKILQFTSPNPPSDTLREYMLYTLNTWANLTREPEDDEYAGSPFSMDKIQRKHDDRDTHWLEYELFLGSLTPEGQLLAKMLFEGIMVLKDGTEVRTPTGLGLLLTGELAPGSGLYIPLRIVEVTNLVTEGYLAPAPLPEPTPTPTPTPTPPPPTYSWPVVPPGYPAPPADAWVFLEATGPQLQARISALQALIPTRFTAGPYMDTYTSTPATGRMVPRWVVHVRDMTAREAVLWGAQHIRATAPAVDAEAGTAQWFE